MWPNGRNRIVTKSPCRPRSCSPNKKRHTDRTMENRPVNDELSVAGDPKLLSAARSVRVQRPAPPLDRQVCVPTYFTSPPPPIVFWPRPPPVRRGFWPPPAPYDAWPQRSRTAVTSTAVTGSTGYHGTAVTGPPCRGSFNSDSRGRAPENARRFSRHTDGDHFTHSYRNARTQWSQNRTRFAGRPVREQRSHESKPRDSVQSHSTVTYQKTIVMAECKTSKRKLKTLQLEKPWNREDAVKAIAAEMEFKNSYNCNQIIIRFPDHVITQQLVQSFHSDIESVRFQAPCIPRYCTVQVDPNADIESVVNELRQTNFQHEKLHVEIKKSQSEKETKPESIDPYTLYAGNFPKYILTDALKNEFPRATHIVICANKTRCAFIKFANAEDALLTYKEKFNLVINGMSVVLKFKRIKANLSGKDDKLLNEKKEFEVQSSSKKIKGEPTEENVDGCCTTFDLSKVKHELLEDEYEHYSYEFCSDDATVKSESDYDEYYDDNYVEVPYTFLQNKSVAADNEIHGTNITIKKEDQRWNHSSDDND